MTNDNQNQPTAEEKNKVLIEQIKESIQGLVIGL